MKNSSIRIVFIFIFFLLTLYIAAVATTIQDTLSGEVKASVLVERKEVPLNRMLTVTVKVEWQGDLGRYEIEELEDPVVSNFEIMGSTSSNRVSETAGKKSTVKEYGFTLQPSSLGMGYIEGIIIKYRDTISLESSRLVTNRLEVKVIDPVPEPGDRQFPWLIIIAIVVVGGAVLAYSIIMKKQEERRRQQELDKIVPPEESFLLELKQAIDISSPDLNIKESFSALSRLYRRYLAQKYSIRALEATTDEVVSTLREQNLDERLLKESDEILKKCDLAKFTGGTREQAELQRAYTLVEDILNRNLHTPMTQPTDTDEGTRA